MRHLTRPQARARRFEETPKCACGLNRHLCGARPPRARPQAAGIGAPSAPRNPANGDQANARALTTAASDSNTLRSCGRLSWPSSQRTSSARVRIAGTPSCSTAASTVPPRTIFRRVSRLRSVRLARAARRSRSARSRASRASRDSRRTRTFSDWDMATSRSGDMDFQRFTGLPGPHRSIADRRRASSESSRPPRARPMRRRFWRSAGGAGSRRAAPGAKSWTATTPCAPARPGIAGI